MSSTNDIHTGPCYVKWRSGYYLFRQGVRITWRKTTIDLPHDVLGSVPVEDSTQMVITGTPVAKGIQTSSNTHAAALFYPAALAPGQKLWKAAADDPLEIVEIHSYNGTNFRRWTALNAAVTQIPSLNLGANRALYGPVTWTGLPIQDADTSEDDTLIWTEDTTLTALPTGWCTDEADDPMGTPHVYGYSSFDEVAGWFEFPTIDGVTIDFALNLQPLGSDTIGQVDASVTDLVVTARFKPLGVTPTEILDRLIGKHAGLTRQVSRGQRMSTVGPDWGFQVKGADLYYLTLRNAALTESSRNHASGPDSNPEITLRAHRTFGSGCALSAPFAFTTSADTIFDAPSP